MKGEFPHTVRFVGSIEDVIERTGKTTGITKMDVSEEPLLWALENIGAKHFSFGGSIYIGGPRIEVGFDFEFERQEDAALFKLFWC